MDGSTIAFSRPDSGKTALECSDRLSLRHARRNTEIDAIAPLMRPVPRLRQTLCHKRGLMRGRAITACRHEAVGASPAQGIKVRRESCR